MALKYSTGISKQQALQGPAGSRGAWDAGPGKSLRRTEVRLGLGKRQPTQRLLVSRGHQGERHTASWETAESEEGEELPPTQERTQINMAPKARAVRL